VASRFWIPGLALGGLGAILAFTLEGGDRSILIIRVHPLGLILLVVGCLFLLWGLLQWWLARRPPPTNGADGTGSRIAAIRQIGGLTAVAIGVGAVAALTIVALTAAPDLSETSTVAISTSAFGVISTVVGAFMGIKIGTDQTGKAIDDSKAAAATVALATRDLTDDEKVQLQKDVAATTSMTQSTSSGGG
jgi:hypothetical protein